MPTYAPLPAAQLEPLMLTPYAFAREVLDLWAFAYGVWFDAAAALACAGLDFCGAAASAQLAASGVEQPLLNDP